MKKNRMISDDYYEESSLNKILNNNNLHLDENKSEQDKNKINESILDLFSNSSKVNSCNLLSLNELVLNHYSTNDNTSDYDIFDKKNSSTYDKSSNHSKTNLILDLDKFSVININENENEKLCEELTRIRSNNFILTYSFKDIIETEALYQYLQNVCKPKILIVASSGLLCKVFLKYDKIKAFGRAKGLVIKNTIPTISVGSQSMFDDETKFYFKKVTQEVFDQLEDKSIKPIQKDYIIIRRKRSLESSIIVYSNLAKLVMEGDIDFMKISQIHTNKQIFLNLLNEAKLSLKQSLIPNEVFLSCWNEYEFVYDASNKRRHYWIYSRIPNKGKTTFLKFLQKKYRCHMYSFVETFQTGIVKETEILIMDEFKEIPIQDLRQMCDGNFQYPVKNSPAVKANIEIVFIASNLRPTQFYGLDSDKDTLDARFIYVDVSNFTFNLDFLEEFKKI